MIVFDEGLMASVMGRSEKAEGIRRSTEAAAAAKSTRV